MNSISIYGLLLGLFCGVCHVSKSNHIYTTKINGLYPASSKAQGRTPLSPNTLVRSSTLLVGPVASVTNYIKTLLSQLLSLVWPGVTSATQPRGKDRPGQGSPHAPFGRWEAGNGVVTPQKIVTIFADSPKNDCYYDSVHAVQAIQDIEHRVQKGTSRGDNILNYINREGCGNIPPLFLILIKLT
jgi:hypothetical protein